MQSVMVRDHPGKANVFFLPTIDFPSSDENCILSTLTFIAYQGKRYGFIKVVTFDQPLGWKSMKNSTAEGPGISVAKVLVRLDGFYTLMSFGGAIGSSMDGSGLTEIFELMYASNTVAHLLDGRRSSSLNSDKKTKTCRRRFRYRA